MDMPAPHAQPLPPAVHGDASALSPEARAEVQRLVARKPVALLLQLLLAWMVIFAAMAWAEWAESVWVGALAVIIVATRQNVLGLLIHEQTHCLAFKAGRGDLAVNLLAAYPLIGITVEGYARVHLAHHEYYFTDRDPDFLRKSGPEWSFPRSGMSLAKLFVSDLMGLNTWRMIKGKKTALPDPEQIKRPSVAPAWLRPLYLLALVAAVAATHNSRPFLLYWLLPLFTVTPAIVRWGAICEHRYNLPDATVEESSPLIIPSWWEKIVLPNLNFSLHPYHHYFPGIPFCSLPTAHQIFRREGLVDEAHVFRGSVAYLKAITRSSVERRISSRNAAGSGGS